MSRALTALLIGSLLLVSGCPSLLSTDVQGEELSAQELFEQAETAYDQERYDKARELYERLSSAHPDFEKMPLVYEKIGDSLYANQEYGRAIARYRQFAELYPGHAHVPRAKYMIGMCYFKQIKSIDLDSRVLQLAADTFEKLKDDPSGGEWAEKAEEKYLECKKKLCEKELYKARIYYKTGKYTSAKVAAKRVLRQCSEVGLDKEANEIIENSDYYAK